MEVKMYLETTLKGPRPGNGWYGYLLECTDWRGEVHTIQDFAYEENITANQLSLMAMYRAMERMTKACDIAVYTDNLYLSSNFPHNLLNWAAGGWQNALGKEIKNRELWQRLWEITRGYGITFEKQYQHAYKSWMVSELQKRRLKYV